MQGSYAALYLKCFCLNFFFFFLPDFFFTEKKSVQSSLMYCEGVQTAVSDLTAFKMSFISDCVSKTSEVFCSLAVLIPL